jgi:adenylate cyclase
MRRATSRLRSFFFPERGLRPWPWIAVVGIAAAIGLLLAFSDQIQRLDWTLDDRFVRVASRVPSPPADIVIVAIDEPSFREMQLAWPWPRRLHAALVDALIRGGARTIVFDIVFDVPAADADDDRLLVEAVSRANRASRVILAAGRADTTDARYSIVQWSDPFPALADAASAIGAVTLLLDPDGVVRRATPVVDGRPTLALAAANVSADERARLIGFRGAPRLGMTTVSYYQALDAERLLPRDVFRGKTVFIGRSLEAAPASDQVDYFPTALGAMPGVEIHASLFDTLVRNRMPADPFTRVGPLVFLCVALAVFAGGICYRLSPLIAGTCLASITIAAFIAAYALRLHDILRLPIVSPLVVSLSVFIVTTGYRHALGTRERRLIKRAFEHYVSPSIVEQMLADPTKLSLAGEEYDTTILFTDLENFSALSEKLTPPEIRAHLSRYLTAMTECVLAEHGTLDRFIGDAILAYFGCPVRDPSHASQACRAALAMMRRMETLNEEWAAAGLPRLRMRIGLNTGRVVAGNMGTDTVFHYTIIGDAVNLASRLEGVNKVYGTGLLAGEETRRSAGAPLVWREIDRIRVKGRSQAVTIATIATVADDSLVNGEALTCYADGLACYRAGDWTRAAELFTQAIALAPADGPSHTLLARCQHYAAAPPPDNWDGVFELADK